MNGDPRRWALWLALAVLWLCGLAHAAPVRSDNAEAEVHLSHAAAAPGETISGALRLTLDPGWHSYWRNPGDSGEPIALELNQAPPGAAIGPLQWPAPEALSVGTPDYPITSYGYEGQVLLPFALTLAADVPAGAAQLQFGVRWLECADVCIPVDRTLTAALEVGPSRLDPVWSARIEAALVELPRRSAAAARLTARPEGWLLTAADPAWGRLRAVRFFPYARDAVAHDAPKTRLAPGQAALWLAPQRGGEAPPASLAGVLRLERAQPGGGWITETVEIEAQAGPPLFAPAAPTQQPSLPLWQAFAYAFLGGLLLNVMPCVFPVLAVKALAFAAAPAAQVRRHGVFYLLGVVGSFLLLAGVLIALQAAGAAVGWGFQLQEPLVVAGLALLFFALGLNLMGVFEVGQSLQGLGGGLAARGGDAGAFFTGALAVAAASPCTAAFMGAALGFAATQPPAVNLAVFAALGLGFALPFSALAFAPGAQRLLPKPGLWMSRFKEALAFPMFATVVFLLWVLAQQLDAARLAVVLLAGLVFAFSAWAARWGRGLMLLAGVAAAALVLGFGLRGGGADAGRAVETAAPGGLWRAWSTDAVAAAQAEGRPVFVDFTAAWCVTCQVNKALVLSRTDVQAAFARSNTALFEGDWTSRSAEIAAELARHGRVGVPLYLLYRPGRPEPEILPQQLDAAALKAKLEAATASDGG